MTFGRPRKSQLNRADLIAAASNDLLAAQYLAAQLGLECQPTEPVTAKIRLDADAALVTGSTSLLQPLEPSNELNPVEGLKPSVGFWRLERREKTVQQADHKEETDDSTPTGWSNRPLTRPTHTPIASPRAFLPRLFHHLKHQRSARELDVAAVVRKLGRGEYLSPIPRLSRRSLGRHLQVIEDRHLHLTPYWLDQGLFARLLTAYLPDYAHSRAVLLEHNEMPQSLATEGPPEDWGLPPERSVVIVFSDLGVLSENPATQIDTWLAIARTLHRRDCTLIAVMPCHPDQCDARLRALFTTETWEPLRQLDKQARCIRRDQANELLTLLAPAIRLEPGLLRSVRRAMSRHDIHFNASVEAAVWQHPDLLEPSSVAATFSVAARKRWLANFADLPAAVRQTVLETIRNWRAPLQEHVWFEEITSLDENSRGLIPETDLNDANHYFQQLSQRYDSDDPEALADVDTRLWFRRIEKRLPQATWHLTQIGTSLQRISAHIHQHDELYHANHPLDPAQLQTVDLPEKTLALYQRGESLIVGKHLLDQVIPLGYSCLALLRLRRGLLYIETLSTARPTEDAVTNGKSVQFQSMTTVCTLPDVSGLMIRSDVETLYLSQIQRPVWATSFARDRYGLYADLNIKGITQRFRWIEPGTFQMGSPENEIGRRDAEALHQVTLSTGFWLADTTVTQALWQAVRGENPSHFNGENCPVEQVNWQESKDFINTLNQLHPDLKLRLPWEAEWEYACRAGTKTPFNFSHELTLDKVNYRGIWETDDDVKWANGAKKQTTETKSYPCNHWGLYEMHGNVWEWCEDVWQKNLGKEAVTDPWQDPFQPETGAPRVVRGGSWGSAGRRCRSAIRPGGEPGSSDSNLGLRLTL